MLWLVVVALTHCALLHFVCDVEAAQMNDQHSLIWKIVLYNFELGYNAAEVTKDICFAKNEGKVDRSTVTRWFKKFHLGCKNLDNQAQLGRPKTIDSGAILQAIEANLVSITQKLSGKPIISLSSVVYHPHDLCKSIQNYQIVLTLPKYCKTCDLP